jgi:hypothetical protein
MGGSGGTPDPRSVPGEANAFAGAAPRARDHRRTATLFAEAGLNPSTVQAFELEEWFAGLPFNDRTRRLHLENVRAAMRHAVRRGVLERDPTE